MKNYLLAAVFCMAITACEKKSKVELEVAEIPVDLKIERFDKLFFETKPQDLDNLKKQYPYFFPAGNDNSIWIEKMQNPLWRELYTEVQKKYANIEPVKKELDVLFKNIKYHFPNTNTPKVITVISEMDYTTKAIYADSLIVISLELYLGKEHKFYQFPKYLKQNFEQRQIAPDVVSSFALRKIPVGTQKDLLAQMVYCGKVLYLKDILLPAYTDEEKIGYTPEQIKWCQENESYMWRYFLEREMLYSSEQKLSSRFINPAPFSKFYLEIDNESPGQVGAWVGWQIVRAYMEESGDSIEELLKTDAKEVFIKSKYKPKK